MKPNLKVVTKIHRPVIDIYANWRAEIASRDWEGVHVRGSRNPPIDLPDRRKWSWSSK